MDPTGVPGVHRHTLARLPAAGRTAGPAPRSGDRILRRRWWPDRPGHPGADRPGLGQRLHRRAGTSADPALHPAAAAAGTDRHPRRIADRAHHPSHAEPGTSARELPSGATWGSSGTSRRPATATSAPLRPGSRCTRNCDRCCTPGEVVVADHPDPGDLGQRRGRRGRLRRGLRHRHCRPFARPGRPAGFGYPAWTRTAATRSRRCYPADFYPEATHVPAWWGKGVTAVRPGARPGRAFRSRRCSPSTCT